MRKIISFIFSVLISFSIGLAVQQTYGDAKVSKLISVYDGDTFKVNIKGWPKIIGEKISIRVAGVDTPEMRGKSEDEKALARIAKEYTKNKLEKACEILLTDIKRGKYFRIVATVIVDGKNLADGLIKKGLAYAYDGGTKQKWA